MIDFTIGDKGVEEKSTSEKHPASESEYDKERNNSTRNALRSDPGLSNFTPFILFSIALVLYIFLATLGIDNKYVDFGDGNYLYLSWRLSEGDVLYKDLHSPQPPMLLFLGSLLMSIGGGGADVVRLWQVFQHVLTACCIWGIAWRIFKRPAISSLAGIIFLFLPEGVWWAAGYQSEPLLILLQCLNLSLFLTAVKRDKPSIALHGSALVMVLCCFTNMTALPYALLQWVFVWLRFRRFFIHYSITFLSLGFLFLFTMMVYSGGQYIEHVFFRQIGTYATGSFAQVIQSLTEKLYIEGGDIIYWEGGFVLASLIGILMFSNEDNEKNARDYLIWWGIFSIGSIIFVTKGGTVEYIFTLGEPAVAVFSAYFFMNLYWAAELSIEPRTAFSSVRRFGQVTLIICLLLPVLCMKQLSLLYMTFTGNPYSRLYQTGVFEVSSNDMNRMSHYIERVCPEDKTLIAPPYYAFLTKRKLAENSSSLLILYATYFNEWERFRQNENAAIDLPSIHELPNWWDIYPPKGGESKLYYNTQAVYDLAALFQTNPGLRKTYPAISLFLNLRERIMNKQVGLIVCNAHHKFFQVPPLQQAIRDFCKIDLSAPQIDNREEITMIFQPK